MWLYTPTAADAALLTMLLNWVDTALYMEDAWLDTVLYAFPMALEIVDFTLSHVADVCDLILLHVVLTEFRKVRNDAAPNVTRLFHVLDRYVFTLSHADAVLV